jgi:hypothetical protein
MNFYHKDTKAQRTQRIHNVFSMLCFCAVVVISWGCGGSGGTASIGWSGEKIRLQLSPSSSGFFSKPTLTCISCQTAIPPFPVSPDANGIVEFAFPQAQEQITTRFYLEANDLDTAFILQPPSPEIASRQYRLVPPLTGRVVATYLTMVYRDTTMADAVSTLAREDEANIFGEDDLYYYVHHPAYREPLVILKSHAIRIQ